MAGNGTSLTNVYYNGTMEDWCNITFSNYSSNPMAYAQHFYMLDSNKEYQEVTEIVIPNTITKIGDYQFSGFKNINYIIIPEGVTSIGEYAFSENDVDIIVLPNSLKNIERYAFNNNPKRIFYNGTKKEYHNIILKDGNDSLINETNAKYYNSNVTSIDIIFNDKYSCFKTSDNRILGLKWLDRTVVSVDLNTEFEGANVIYLGDSAFYNCSYLTTITLPDTLTSIGSYAFKGCTNLRCIKFLKEMNVVLIGTGTFEEYENFYINYKSFNFPSRKFFENGDQSALNFNVVNSLVEQINQTLMKGKYLIGKTSESIEINKLSNGEKWFYVCIIEIYNEFQNEDILKISETDQLELLRHLFIDDSEPNAFMPDILNNNQINENEKIEKIKTMGDKINFITNIIIKKFTPSYYKMYAFMFSHWFVCIPAFLTFIPYAYVMVVATSKVSLIEHIVKYLYIYLDEIAGLQEAFADSIENHLNEFDNQNELKQIMIMFWKQSKNNFKKLAKHYKKGGGYKEKIKQVDIKCNKYK